MAVIKNLFVLLCLISERIYEKLNSNKSTVLLWNGFFRFLTMRA